MNYCDKCKIQVVGNRKYCPLCQNELRKEQNSGEPEKDMDVFPYIPTLYEQHHMFFKILSFLSIVVIVINVTINIIFYAHGWWSLFVVAGVICLWLSMFMAFNKRKNIPKNIFYQVVIISLISIFWDYLTGWRGWSVDFVIPITCLSVMLSMVFISKIMHSDVEDFMIYTIIGGLFGILPIFFLAIGILNVRFPSLICVAPVLFSFLLFLYSREIK